MGSEGVESKEVAAGLTNRQVAGEALAHEDTEVGEPFGPGLALGRLDDQDVRQVRGVRIDLVPFEALEERQLADPMGAPAEGGEAAGGERLLQETTVPEEAVPPGIEAAVDRQGRAHPPLPAEAPVVDGGEHPFEIGGGESQPAVRTKGAVGLQKEVERLLDRQVLQEVLGENGAAVRELQPPGHVGHHVDPGERLEVDVDPARERRTAAADMEGGAGGGGKGGSLAERGVGLGGGVLRMICYLQRMTGCLQRMTHCLVAGDLLHAAGDLLHAADDLLLAADDSLHAAGDLLLAADDSLLVADDPLRSADDSLPASR